MSDCKDGLSAWIPGSLCVSRLLMGGGASLWLAIPGMPANLQLNPSPLMSDHCWCASGKPERWVHAESKRPHSHDVRALTVAAVPGLDPVLISAGNDAQILVHSVPRYTQVCARTYLCSL